MKRILYLLAEILAEIRALKAAITKQGDATWRQTPDGRYICPKHESVMTKREKQGDVWHSHKVIDPLTGDEALGRDGKPLYCRGYACKSGAGYWHGSTATAVAVPMPEPYTQRIEVNIKTPETKAAEETADQLFRPRAKRYGDDTIVPARDMGRFDVFVADVGREPESQKELYVAVSRHGKIKKLWRK